MYIYINYYLVYIIEISTFKLYYPETTKTEQAITERHELEITRVAKTHTHVHVYNI